MKRTELFTKTLRNAPSDEVSRNAQLLIRAGFVYKEMAGVYDFLPLGLRVIAKIENIIREEMNAIGGTEMRTAALQNPAIWEQSNRWDDKIVDNWFKTELKNGGSLGLSFTNEETFANLMKTYIHSYKDLPAYPYDFKEMFRNETRAKSGIMRGREFYWKALYSFSRDETQHAEFYEKAKQAYLRVFNRVGIGDKTFLTFASGGTFAEFSHEFQTLADAGEDLIYVDHTKNIAINREVLTDDNLAKIGVKREDLDEQKAVEVGNIFSLADKFSTPLDLFFTDEDGSRKPVFMGSYGIGLGRLMGTIVETLSDEKGLVWPEVVAPFRVYLVNIGDDEEVIKAAQKLYDDLKSKNIEVLWDDRDARPGEKFADADLMGMPHRVVVSNRTLALGHKMEYKKRQSGASEILSVDELFAKLS